MVVHMIMNDKLQKIWDTFEAGRPLPSVERTVVQAIKQGIRQQTNVPIFGFGQESYIPSFIKEYSKLLKDCNIYTIHLADQTHNLMNGLKKWIDLDWEFAGMQNVLITVDNIYNVELEAQIPVIILERDDPTYSYANNY